MQPMVQCWEQSSSGGQGRTQPRWSSPPHLRLCSGAGALRPFTRSEFLPYAKKPSESLPHQDLLARSCYITVTSLCPKIIKGKKKIHISKTAPKTFSKLGDCSSAPYGNQRCPQSNSLILSSDMEFHFSCTDITLLHQNVVYQNSGLSARMYCFADQFYISNCDIQLIRKLLKILTHSLCQAEIF